MSVANNTKQYAVQQGLWQISTISMAMLLLSSLLPVRAEVISLRADAWCPYNCEPDSDKPGYMIEIMQAVFEPLGYEIDYQTINWPRAITQARNGEIDGIIGALKEEVPDFIFPAPTLGVANNAFWTQAANPWRYDGITSLENITLGVINGYDYGDTAVMQHIERHRKTLGVQVISGETALLQNIKKLAAGRLDVVLEDENVFANQAQQMDLAEAFVMAGRLNETTEVAGLYIAFSPQRAVTVTYAQQLGAGLVQLRASGALASILARYGLRDWE